MTLFPLDALRNASIDRTLEPLLEEVRRELQMFPFSEDVDGGDAEAVVEAFDMARPRLNVLAAVLRDAGVRSGADISTGIGFLPAVLQRLGLTVHATERDSRVGRFAAEHGIDVREYVIGHGSPPFEAGSLDFVVFGEVLEHIKSPSIRAIGAVTSILRPGGMFLLTTPNIARLEHIEALVSGENFLEPFPEDLPPGYDPTDAVEHVREYSVREAVEAVEGAGLGVESLLMTGWGGTGYAPPANPWVNDLIVISARK